MSITYFNEDKTFKLDTVNSTYLIHIVDKGFLLHGYYGRKISDHNTTYLTRIYEFPFYPAVNNRENGSFMDAAPFEYPASDRGDYRGRAIEAESLKGYRTFDMRYVSHRIYEGKPKLEGLPATFAGKDEADTLEIECLEPVLNINVTLLYSVFKNKDVITRSVIVKNNSEEAVYLTRIMSLCLDMDNEDYDLITLNGSWARERHIDRRRIHKGMTSVSSSRGESSHQEHPFLAVLDHNATNDHGSVYGFNFVYSGNFTASVNYTQFDSLRIMMGINPCDFRWKLEPCESFVSPEAVMVYSGNGLNEMTHTFHDLYRNNLIRSPYKDKKRPILINNWEATYFDFDSEKLLSIAREAGKSGIEMLVMDDGWFGTRSSDNMALGDWYVNEDKLKGGLKALVDRINEIPVAGTDKKMKFGIWVEPEMISPDSDLFREHPDYAIQIPDRDPALIRNQLVLDLSRKEVVDCIYSMISKVLKSANIEYVKWDMNRGLTDLGSCLLPGERQGELLHRYMLGVYDMQERLVNDFPDLLLENCSSGGARFDPGMLYYSPQIWCSDDTDAIERLAIQEGTALIYPLSCIGAHVSDCPNHTVFRNTPFKTRGDVALLGTFGYELDITKIPEEDRAMIPKQVEQYHKFHMLIQDGDYYRISSFRENNLYDCTEVVKKDRSEALVTFVQVLARA
ncbi:MAG: alpha-galactosidase, partial [Lachnospiraceae bacterium]|nr:alpha-galactosidase [Lachnospiraceae bacterium]